MRLFFTERGKRFSLKIKAMMFYIIMLIMGALEMPSGSAASRK